MGHLEGVKGFLIDMDGTIYKGMEPIPGAKEFISYLKAKNIPFAMLTNNSSSSRSHYLRKLTDMGFDVGMENILTSSTATILHLQAHCEGKAVYPLGTPQFMEELQEAGILVSDTAPIVLLAFDRTITYEKINRAYHLLLEGAELIATHPDDLCPTEDGYDVDVGPFIRMFEELTGRKASVIGKPNAAMAEMASLHLNVPVSQMAMIGDRLYTDMRMAVENGMTSILVLSGEADRGSLQASGMSIDVVVDSVADLVGKT